MEEKRKTPRTDQTASDLYWTAIREGKTHAEAAAIVERVMLAEERDNA